MLITIQQVQKLLETIGAQGYSGPTTFNDERDALRYILTQLDSRIEAKELKIKEHLRSNKEKYATFKRTQLETSQDVYTFLEDVEQADKRLETISTEVTALSEETELLRHGYEVSEEVLRQLDQLERFGELWSQLESDLESAPEHGKLKKAVKSFISLQSFFNSAQVEEEQRKWIHDVISLKRSYITCLLEERLGQNFTTVFHSDRECIELFVNVDECLWILRSFKDCEIHRDELSFGSLSRKFARFCFMPILKGSEFIVQEDHNDKLIIKISSKPKERLQKEEAEKKLGILEKVLAFVKRALDPYWAEFSSGIGRIVTSDFNDTMVSLLKQHVPSEIADFGSSQEWINNVVCRIVSMQNTFRMVNDFSAISNFGDQFFHHFASAQVHVAARKVRGILLADNYDYNIEVGLPSRTPLNELLSRDAIDNAKVRQILQKNQESKTLNEKEPFVPFYTCRISSKVKQAAEVYDEFFSLLEQSSAGSAKELIHGLSKLMQLYHVFYTIIEKERQLYQLPQQLLILHNDYYFLEFKCTMFALMLKSEDATELFKCAANLKSLRKNTMNTIVRVHAAEIMNLFDETSGGSLDNLTKLQKRNNVNNAAHQVIFQVQKICKQWMPILPARQFLEAITSVTDNIYSEILHKISSLSDIRADECAYLCSIFAQPQEEEDTQGMTKNFVGLLKELDKILLDQEKRIKSRSGEDYFPGVLPASRDAVSAVLQILDSSLEEIMQRFRSGYYKKVNVPSHTIVHLILATFSMSDSRSKCISEIEKSSNRQAK